MKIAQSAFSTWSIAMLLALVSGTAFANPGQRAWREELRAMQQQQAWREQTAREERTDSQGSSNAAPNANPEPQKKPGKMSAEERRALRRQINEAGRDIYAPGR